MFFRNGLRSLVIPLTCLLLCLGAVEGWYGRLFYSIDAISYLDAANAIRHGDWKTAFSPYWGFSYSFLIALTRPLFPAGPQGEWAAVHVLNLVVLLAMWFCFLGLVKTIAELMPGFNDKTNSDGRSRGSALLVFGAFCVFTSFEICAGNVSRVSADPLVCCLVFLALWLLVGVVRRPSARPAAVLGVVLGLGYWTKAALLPFAAVALGVLLWKSTRANRKVLLAASGAFFVVAVPYALAISWAFGRPSMGESGPLNYAWCVNGLMKSVHWQGGPPEFGTPVHPTRMLLADPPVFAFGGQFAVTYPPFFDPPYWYDGYRHLFRWRNQVAAIVENVKKLVGVLVRNRFVYFWAAFVALFLVFSSAEMRTAGAKWMGQQWVVAIPVVAAIALYLQVWVEERYVSGYLAVLAAIPVILAAGFAPNLSRKSYWFLVAVLFAGLAVDVVKTQKLAWVRLWNREDYQTHDEWKIGRELTHEGFHRGEPVATVNGPMYYNEWAHIAGLRIVAEMAPPETDPSQFWRLSAALQAEVLTKLRSSGAIAAVAVHKPTGMVSSGWQRIPGTPGFVYRF